MDKYFELLDMCMRLLEKIERLQEAEASLRRENDRLHYNLQKYQQEEARKSFMPAMYGCTPGNDEIRKEGEA